EPGNMPAETKEKLKKYAEKEKQKKEKLRNRLKDKKSATTTTTKSTEKKTTKKTTKKSTEKKKDKLIDVKEYEKLDIDTQKKYIYKIVNKHTKRISKIENMPRNDVKKKILSFLDDKLIELFGNNLVNVYTTLHKYL